MILPLRLHGGGIERVAGFSPMIEYITGSCYYRRRHCPGSWYAEFGIPDETSEDAADGQRQHAVLARAARRDAEILDDINGFRSLDARGKAFTITAWQFVRNTRPSAPHRMMIEKRLRKVGVSGQPDIFVIHDRDAILWEYKSGRGEVDEAQDNDQLATYAMLIRSRYRVRSVTGYIISAATDTPSSVRFGPEELDDVVLEIRDAVKRCSDPEARRTPGPWCKWCRAQGRIGRCPESVSSITDHKAAFMTSRTIPDVAIGEMLERAKVASAAIKAFRFWVRARVAAGQTIPGVTLGKPPKEIVVTDPSAVFAAGLTMGWWTERAFVNNCVDVRIDPVVELIRKRADCSVREARRMLVELPSGVEVRERSPSLEVRHEKEVQAGEQASLEPGAPGVPRPAGAGEAQPEGSPEDRTPIDSDD